MDGIEQEPMDGTSFVYTFDDASAAERHTVQYSESFGSRAIYKDGWWACARIDRVPWGFSPETLARFAPGVYDIAQAANVRFYRFFLGPNSKRFDGKAFRGAITIERAQDGMLIGTMDIMINGMTKSFTEPSANFSSTLSGSFRIKEVPIEATVVKGKQ